MHLNRSINSFAFLDSRIVPARQVMILLIGGANPKTVLVWQLSFIWTIHQHICITQ